MKKTWDKVSNAVPAAVEPGVRAALSGPVDAATWDGVSRPVRHAVQNAVEAAVVDALYDVRR